jgi:hypothetical protein
LSTENFRCTPLHHLDAESIVLVLRPAETEPQAHTPPGDHVERGDPTREHHRVVVGDVEHARAKSDPLRVRGHERQGLQRVQDVLVLLGQ